MLSLSGSADENLRRKKESSSLFHSSTAIRQRPVAQSAPKRKNAYSHSESANSLAALPEAQMLVKTAECPICLEELNENSPSRTPRNLSCGHAYCTGCLKKLLRSSDFKIQCPTCSNITQINDQLVSSLPKNYPLLQVMRTIVKSPHHSMRSDASPVHLQSPKCLEHDDYLRRYCLRDRQLICSSCELYGAHKGHPTKFLSEAASAERKKLMELNPEVLRQKEKMERALARVEGTFAEVTRSGGRMEDDVDEYFQNLIALVEEKKQHVKTEVRLRTQIRVNALMEQGREMKGCIVRAETVHKKAESLLDGDDYSVLNDAMVTLDLIEGVFVNPPPTTPSARNDLKCKFSSENENEIASSLINIAIIMSDMLTIDSSEINVQAFHNGFRISWEGQNFADNHGITYHLQTAAGHADYIIRYRGSSTKYTWKTDLEDDVTYRFRVQVRTTEGVGNWSQAKEARKAIPDMHWHRQWLSVKVELSASKLVATCRDGGSSSQHHWATFGADKFFEANKHYYTEIEILNLGKAKVKEKLVIGLLECNKSSVHDGEWQNRKKHVGEWTLPSWSFLPDSGLLKSPTTSSDGVPYGKDLMIQAGDRIGVLVDMYEKKLTYFCNGNDLGVAFEDLFGQSFLLAISVRAKIQVRLMFPPPPYSKRTINIIKLRSVH